LAQSISLLRLGVDDLGRLVDRGPRGILLARRRRALGVLLEDQLLAVGARAEDAARPHARHVLAPVGFELLEGLSISLRDRLAIGKAVAHGSDQLGERRLPAALVE